MPPRYPIFVLTVAVLIGLCFGATPSAAQPPFNVIGQWSQPFQPFTQPYFPVHSHMLPTGKVMFWPGDGGVSGNDPRSWDPANPGQSASSLSKPGYDIFCSGHSFLADGRLFVAGGHNGSNNVGLSRASTYNPFATTNAWSNLSDMNDGRWYPTTTVLANGDILVVSGSIDLTVGSNPEPQVFQIAPAPGMWRDLTNAHLVQSLYPWMLLAPNGRVFHAGWTATTRYLNTVGDGAWSVVANRVDGVRDYGSAVMYEPGKVLVMGGGSPPKNTAEVIDLNEGSPSWRLVDSMEFSRRQINATLLPDGTVLVTGGTDAPGFSEPSGHKDAAELWDPATGNWTTLASSSGIPRVYHSTALLLPDGRVLSTGGNGHPETEIYSPPYLFKGARPTITSAPASIAYGQSFFVGTPNTAAISKIRILRLSSVTHAFNQSQYINELSFSPTFSPTTGLNVTAPRAAAAIESPGLPPVVAPPGYYLLFILNGSGVPSVAQIIRLSGTASPPPPPPPAPPPPPPPPPAPPPPPPVSTITIGETSILSVTDGNNGNRLIAQRATLSQTATIQSLSFYIVTASGNLRLGIYDATGPGGGPGAKKAETASITPTTGWNTANVTPVSLSPGTYWLAYLPSSNSLKFKGESTGGTSKLYSFPFQPMPATFSTTPGSSVWRWSLYATLTLNTADTIPPTVSIDAPTSGATISGTVTVEASASDSGGVAGVQFKLDGPNVANNLGAEDTTSPYSVTWNTTTATNGSHTLTAVARDAAGNVTTSTGVSVTVNNASPPPPPPPAPPPPPPPPPAPPPPPPPPPAPPPPPPPPPAPPPPPPVSTITIGETSILSVTDGNNGNRLIAQRATLSQTATIQSLSFYIVTASGNLRLGIYDATGPGGGPGAKKAETASITPTTGWNTANVTPVSLPPGTYWLAYLPSSKSLKFKGESTGGTSKLYSFPFQPMPATFSTTPGSSVWRWSLYATLTLN